MRGESESGRSVRREGIGGGIKADMDGRELWSARCWILMILNDVGMKSGLGCGDVGQVMSQTGGDMLMSRFGNWI
jgi:hypothetical protein